MFGLFKKDPIKELEKRYADLMEQAMNKQRSGDIEGYANLTAKAEEVLNEIEKLKNKKD